MTTLSWTQTGCEAVTETGRAAARGVEHGEPDHLPFYWHAHVGKSSGDGYAETIEKAREDAEAFMARPPEWHRENAATELRHRLREARRTVEALEKQLSGLEVAP